jgi:hypothetical protein
MAYKFAKQVPPTETACQLRKKSKKFNGKCGPAARKPLEGLTRTASLDLLRQGCQRSLELNDIDGLDQMQVETGRASLLMIFIASIACQGDQVCELEVRILAQLSGDIVAAHAAGQTNIAQDHLGET